MENQDMNSLDEITEAREHKRLVKEGTAWGELNVFYVVFEDGAVNLGVDGGRVEPVYDTEGEAIHHKHIARILRSVAERLEKEETIKPFEVKS